VKKVVSFLLAIASPGIAFATPVDNFWSLSVEKLETRIKAGGDQSNAAETSFEYGDDNKRLLIKSVYEYSVEETAIEKFDTVVGIKFPVSKFYDAVVGARIDAPDGEDQYHGYLGLQGLTEQFFHVGVGLSVSEYPSVEFGAEYEGRITNWLTLSPSFEMMVPLKDNLVRGDGAGGARIEFGLRLSYDVLDRTISPYIGIHQESLFGETANLARSEGKGTSNFVSVVGVKILF
jgi:copper resistance protein B